MGLAVLTISLSTLLRKALEAKKAEKEYQSSIAEFISNVEVTSPVRTDLSKGYTCSRPLKRLVTSTCSSPTILSLMFRLRALPAQS